MFNRCSIVTVQHVLFLFLVLSLLSFWFLYFNKEIFNKNILFLKGCSKCSANVQFRGFWRGAKVFWSRQMSITIVFPIKSYLSLNKEKLEISRQNRVPPETMSKPPPPQRWPPFSAVSRDPTLIFLWGCSQDLALSNCETPAQNGVVFWEKIDLQNPGFLKKPVFQRRFSDVLEELDGWNF